MTRLKCTPVALLLLLAGLAACSGRPAPAPPAAGQAVPAVPAPVSFADLPAIQESMTEMRGRPLLLNFWASWCGPCVMELPDLAAAARDYGGDDGKGPQFVGVSLDAWVTGNGQETETKVRDALARAGVSYTNFIYQGDQDPLLNGFEIPGAIPYSILYDGSGRKVATWDGMIEVGALRKKIAALR
jgi:thiol-disulfide isomerase/thioredoxin